MHFCEVVQLREYIEVGLVYKILWKTKYHIVPCTNVYCKVYISSFVHATIWDMLATNFFTEWNEIHVTKQSDYVVTTVSTNFEKNLKVGIDDDQGLYI